MLFSWSIGSSGSGSDRFALYVPFTVSLGCEISSIDREIEHNINGYKFRIEKLINFYAITVGEFNSFGNVIGVIGFNAENFVKFIAEAISFESPGSFVEDKKLQLAISLYSASHYEVSDSAKFITLVNVLEALKKQEEIPDMAREVLKSAKSFIKEKRDLYEKNSNEWNEI